MAANSTYGALNLNRANVTIGTTSGNQVALNGFQYTGNTQYIINFSVINPSNRSGFEMSAITPTNTTAGTFARTNTTNTTLQTYGGIQYIGHRNAGTTSSWSFNWTSPATTTGNITFYSAINRSNNNNSDTGDSIFHQQFVISPAPAAVTVDAGNNVSVCPGTATQLQASASVSSGTTYAWSPVTGLSCTNCANPVASPSSTTAYTVTATSGGQTATDVVTVTTYTTTAPAINSASNTVCPGSSLALSSSGFSSYAWSTGSNVATTSVTAAGTYTLTVTDANGCSTSASKTIQQGQTPSTTISSTQPYICGNSSVTLSAGTFSGYLWSNNSTASTITVNQQGGYQVTVTNGSGCSATAGINVTAYALPAVNITASGPLSFCSGGSVALTANSAAATSYKWSTGETTATITVTQSGAYTATVYNPCDSAVSQTQTVAVNSVPVAQIAPAGSVLLCNNATQTLRATPAGLSYTWLKNGVAIQGQSADTLGVSAAGNYAVAVTQNACSDTSLVMAVSTAGAGNAAVNITASENTICAGSMVTLDAGGGFASYNWLPGNVATQNLQVSAAGTYIVNVTVNNGQCTGSGADTITINAGPAVIVPTLSYNPAVCAGDSMVIQVTPASYTTYIWSNGSVSPFLNDVTGNYSVTVSQNGYCGTATASLSATGTAPPDASFGVNGAVLTANTTGAFYQWYLDNAPVSNANAATYTATQTGSYALQVTQNGCSSLSPNLLVIVNGIEAVYNNVSVKVYPNPVLNTLNIKCEVSAAQWLKLSVAGMDGALALPDQNIYLQPGENNRQVDLSLLPAGIYVLHLQGEGVADNIRLVKQGL